MFLNQLKETRLKRHGFLQAVFAVQTHARDHAGARLPLFLPRAPAGAHATSPALAAVLTVPQGWGKETEGSPTGWQGQRQNPGSAGQGRLSRERFQLGGGWVGIWTKPHCQSHMMPLTYFPVGEHSGDAHGAHVAPKRDMSLLSPRSLSRFQIPFQDPLDRSNHRRAHYSQFIQTWGAL